MFGFSSKPGRDEWDDANLNAWQRSPSVPITRARGRTAAYLLANVGCDIAIRYKGEVRIVRPLGMFHKPEYGRTYLQAIDGGESKSFNMDDLAIPRRRKVESGSPRPSRLLRSRRQEQDESPSIAMSLVGCLTLVGGMGIAVMVCCGGIGGALNTSPPAANVPASPPKRRVTTQVVRETPKPRTVIEATPVLSESPSVVHELPGPSGQPSDAPEQNLSPAIKAPSAFGREFTSKIGTSVRAEFIEFQFQGSRVILRREDGRPLSVSMNDLSKEDQQWIRDELKRRKQ